MTALTKSQHNLVSTFISSPTDSLLKNSTSMENFSPTSTDSSIHNLSTSGYYSSSTSSSLKNRSNIPPPACPAKQQQFPTELETSRPVKLNRIFVTMRSNSHVEKTKTAKILQRKNKTSSLELNSPVDPKPDSFYTSFYMPKSATFEKLTTTFEESDSDEENDHKSCTSIPTSSSALQDGTCRTKNSRNSKSSFNLRQFFHFNR